MTPVDAMIISDSSAPTAAAALLHMDSAMNSPSLLQVLAFPELQSMALAFPSSKCFAVTVRGAPLTLFFVYTAAALHSVSEYIRARSFFFFFFFIHACTPPAENPFDAHTPPSIKVYSIKISP